MMSYAIFIYSEMFHTFLNVSTYFQNLLKSFFRHENENSRFFSKIPECFMIEYF